MQGGVTHDCASILDSIAKKTSCFHYFSHGASLHHCSFSRMIFTLVSRIFVKLAPVARAYVNLRRCALLSRAEFNKDGFVFSSQPYTVQCS